MGEDGLRELLARLHQHLSTGDPVDGESRELLGTVLRDIERTLWSGGAAAATAGHADLPRLEALAVRFEASHPGLAQTLREAIDTLAKAGI